MKTFLIVLLCILVVAIIAVIALYFYGKKQEKKQAEREEQMKSAAQTVTMLVIDKKRMKLKDAGFPPLVLENTPKYLRRAKVPVVKAKVGPQIVTLMCDEKVYDLVPVKKEVKAVLSGIYIMDVKGIRGTLTAPSKEELKEAKKQEKKNKKRSSKSK